MDPPLPNPPTDHRSIPEDPEQSDNVTSRPIDPPVEPGEALAETVAKQGVDPAEIEQGDDKIGEHIAAAEENTPV